MIRGVFYGTARHEGVTRQVSREDLARHETHTVSLARTSGHAADADAVVVDGADRTCDMRAVAAGSDLRIMAAEVVAAGALSVAPDIRCQIGMRIVDAAVHQLHLFAGKGMGFLIITADKCDHIVSVVELTGRTHFHRSDRW